MSIRLYVPGDSGARSVGANRVVRAIALEADARRLDIQIIRNGSRGLYWLEPLVEVECAAGRIAYGRRSMPTPNVVRQYGKRWKPYRTAAAWYLWRAADRSKKP